MFSLCQICQNSKIIFGNLRKCIKYSHGKGPARSKYTVVMVRHGESEWNKLNRFTGWYDAKLSEQGKKEAKNAGIALKKAGYKFDLAYTSVLTRAINTLDAILTELGQNDIKIVRTWRLNERHYGELTGLNKKETAAKFGEKQVVIWRRSFDIPPPPITDKNEYKKLMEEDPRYKDGPPKDQFPKAESLKLTIDRTLPFWNDQVVKSMREGKKVIIAAHGNSLRGIVKVLDNISDKDITQLNLPTGIPFVYVLDDNMKPTPGGSMKFLGDPETVKKAMEAVAKQGKA